MNKDIDKIIREKFSAHESEFRKSMWDEIDTAINPPKRKNRFLFFGILGALMLLSVVGVALWFGQSDDAPENTISITEALSTNNSTAKEVTDNPTPLSSSSEEPIDQLTKNTTEYTTLDIDVKESVTRVNEVFTTPIESTSSSNNATYSKNTPTRNTNFTSIEPSASFLSKALNQKITTDHSTLVIREEAVTKNRASGSHLSITFTEPILDKSITKSRTYKNKSAASGQVGSSSEEAHSYWNLPAPDWALDGLKIDSEIPYMYMRATKGGTSCPSWIRNKNGFYVETYYSPEFAIRSVTGKNTKPLTVQHQKDRNELESALLSYSFGARLVFLSQNGLSFKTGMNFSQINERFQHYDPNADQLVTITDQETGEIIDQWIEYGEVREDIVNRYKSIDIPALIGFEKYKGKKLSYSVNAGVYLNIYSEQRGKFLNSEGDSQWFTSGSDGNYKAYRNNVGASFFGSMGLMYHWVEGIDLFMEPSLRYYLRSITTDEYPLRQNYAVIGLHTGLRYRF